MSGKKETQIKATQHVLILKPPRFKHILVIFVYYKDQNISKNYGCRKRAYLTALRRLAGCNFHQLQLISSQHVVVQMWTLCLVWDSFSITVLQVIKYFSLKQNKNLLCYESFFFLVILYCFTIQAAYPSITDDYQNNNQGCSVVACVYDNQVINYEYTGKAQLLNMTIFYKSQAIGQKKLTVLYTK